MGCDDLIKKGIEQDCDNPIVKGIEANGVIFNRADIDFAATKFDDTRKNVIKELATKDGAKGYQVYVPGQTPFNGTKSTMEVGTNRNTFTNDLGFVVLNNDPDVCANIIDPLAHGSFVVVYENVYKNNNKTTNAGDSTFQIVGFYQGLKAQALENDKYSDDTEGGWTVTLQETKVPKAALFLYNGDVADTRVELEKLTK